MVIFGNFTLLQVLLTFIVIIVTYVLYSLTYWRRRNVPYLAPILGPPSKPLALTIHEMYDVIKRRNQWKYAGFYILIRPQIMITDLDCIKTILVKDFEYFTDRGLFYNEKDDPISASLFTMTGNKWHQLRTKLTPTFTSGKMRQMFQTLVDCKLGLIQQIDERSRENLAIDIKETTGRYTTDIIGSCAFGLDCNSFNDEESPFRQYGRRIFRRTRLQRFLLQTLVASFPNLARSLHFRLFDSEISDFFINTIKATVDYRKSNRIERRDFLQLLIELKNNRGQQLTLNEMAAQSFIFFVAGFETSSTTMTFALYELAKNQAVQERLRQEIGTVLARHDNQITYDSINEMKYMNQVIDETLRKYPPIPALPRVCVKDYKLPETDIIIEKGTRVLIPVYGIHHDPEYYPDPDRFDPERFNDTNRTVRHQFTHLPFGEGPRICIGMRFGLMQTKVGLTAMLKDFKFTLNECTKEPIMFDRSSIVLAAVDKIWLNAEKI